jgi:hypothetical protein
MDDLVKLASKMRPDRLDYAQTLALAGQTEACLDALEKMTHFEQKLSPYQLTLNPMWKPLHDHPRFVRILEGLQKKR